MKMADYFKEDPAQQTNYLDIGLNGEVRQIDSTRIDILIQENEAEILKNVDINFLFAKGYELSDSLIDLNRVYLVVNKIKELARLQALEGSKDINYDELVLFMKQLDDSNQTLMAATNDPAEDQEQRWS